MTILESIVDDQHNHKKSLAVLLDPDKNKMKDFPFIVELANAHDVDYFFVGGSLLIEDILDQCVQFVKENSSIPILLFPGNEIQIHPDADGILFLSLISGRNPDFLIGKHVYAAPKLKSMNLEIIPTGYILIHGSQPSTASYMSNTQPIPPSKPQITVCTALAGEMLGHQLIYLEGGSGTQRPVLSSTIKAVKNAISAPLIVGGGICSVEKLSENYEAGADIQVVGTAFETNPELIRDFAVAKSEINNQYKMV